MKLNEYIDVAELGRLIDDGLVSARRHPNPRLDLTVLNYTPKAVSSDWGQTLRRCRGLVYSDDLEIQHHGFEKFFNWGDPKTGLIPPGTPRVFEKADGCFRKNTLLSVWGGGNEKIGEVVEGRKELILVGMNSSGEIVPTKILDWFDNGKKKQWMEVVIGEPGEWGKTLKRSRSLKVTPNHAIFCEGEYRQAASLKQGEYLTRYDVLPNDDVIHMIESGLLGDGSVSRAGKYYTYSDSHVERHEEYCNYIEGWLGDCAIKRRKITSGYGSKMIQIVSSVYEKLSEIRDKWYPNGRKEVPEDLNWMDDFSVAKWYMDDGSLAHTETQKDRANFATNGFSEKDVRRLGKKLEEMYGVCPTVSYQKGWCIRVKAGKNGEINNFWNRIAPHIVPCMRYKLPEEFRNISYEERKRGTEKIIPVKTQIKEIKDIPTWTRYAEAYDIHTETGNYFADGILVHNSYSSVFWYKNELVVNTRGSFESDQAKWAKNWIQNHFTGKICSYSERELSFIFEVIIPEDRKVVDYDYSGLVLLGAINRDGTEYSPECVNFYISTWLKDYKVVKEYDYEDLGTLQAKNIPNEEGYVVTYYQSQGPAFRVKLKFSDYVRLHKIIFNTSSISIWDLTRRGDCVSLVLDGATDEIKVWANKLSEQIQKDHDSLKNSYTGAFRSINTLVNGACFGIEVPEKERRKTFALYAKPYAHPELLFSLYDARLDKFEDQVWELVKPVKTFFRKPESEEP